MIIEGTVEEIVFRNEDNGYTVAIVCHNDEITTVVGKLLSINVGETVRLKGEFTTNSKYGEQFAFTTCETIFPSSKEGIEKYLSSGLVKGIGPVTAKAIVDVFGNETLDVIEFNPEKLVKVRGISENKALDISATIGKLKNLQNTMMFLQNYNITTNMALKIFAEYSEKTIEIVKQNPYKLVEDIDGIGFFTADKIAMSMGIEQKSPFRIRAAILHILQESADKVGHTFVYKEELTQDTCNLLALQLDEIESKFSDIYLNLTFDKFITVLNKKGKELVMLSKFYFTESIVAQKLAMLNASSKNDNFDLSTEMNNFEQVNKIKFHEEQKNAIQNAVNTGVSIITGGPGTGKTTIIKCIIEILEQARKKVLLIAPTGRAAKKLNEATNHEAKTIHRALEVDFKNEETYFKYNETNPLDVDVVIVDEVSMVDIMLMHSLMKALPRDAKLVLVGDKDQLPSVGAGNVLDDIIKSEVISVSYLTQIYRQDENSLIIQNAHAINNGDMPEIDNNSKDFFFERQPDPSSTKKSVVELITSRIPQHFKIDSTKIQVLAPLKAGVCGVENLNIELQEKLNPSSPYKREIFVGKTIFREGDKVMQTINNYNLTWTKANNKYFVETGLGIFNGDIGYIHKIDIKTGEVTIWFDDGRESVYPRTEIIQLTLAYSTTIHKSQGSEFDAVVIPVVPGPSIILTRNLIYTAVTRAKKLVVIVGDKMALRRMINNTHYIKRHTMLKDFLIDSNKKVCELFN